MLASRFVTRLVKTGNTVVEQTHQLATLTPVTTVYALDGVTIDPTTGAPFAESPVR